MPDIMLTLKNQFVLFISIILFGLMLNFYNLHFIQTQPTTKPLLLHDATLISADNFYYINHIKNYLSGKGFSMNNDVDDAAVRRTPVYPLFYGFHYFLFGESKAHHIIRYTQLLLFAFSVILLGKCILNFGGNKRSAMITMMLTGFNPVLLVFTFYTITESLFPALLMMTLYFLSCCYAKPSRAHQVCLGITVSLAVLCRPVLALLIIPLGIWWLVQYKQDIKKGVVAMLMIAFGAALIFSPWIIRNYRITNGLFIPLEKTNIDDPMSYGKCYTAWYRWIDAWTNSANIPLESLYSKMVININTGEPLSKVEITESILNEFPSQAWQFTPRDSLKENLILLYDYTKSKIDGEPGLQQKDLSLAEKFNSLKQSIKTNFPIHFYVVNPLLTLKSVMFQSNSYPIAFLNNPSSSITIKLIKGIQYLYNIICFLVLAWSLFSLSKNPLLVNLCIAFSVVYLLLFIFVIKHFEARYLIPLAPMFAILVGNKSDVISRKGLKKTEVA